MERPKAALFNTFHARTDVLSVIDHPTVARTKGECSAWEKHTAYLSALSILLQTTECNMVQQHLRARGQSCLFCYDIWNIYFNQQTPAKVIQHGHHDSEFLWRLVEIQIYQSRGAPLSRDEKNSDTVLPKQTARWKWVFFHPHQWGLGKPIQSPQHPFSTSCSMNMNVESDWYLVRFCLHVIIMWLLLHLKKMRVGWTLGSYWAFKMPLSTNSNGRMLSFSSCKQPFGFAKDITFWKNSSGIKLGCPPSQ